MQIVDLGFESRHSNSRVRGTTYFKAQIGTVLRVKTGAHSNYSGTTSIHKDVWGKSRHRVCCQIQTSRHCYAASQKEAQALESIGQCPFHHSRTI